MSASLEVRCTAFPEDRNPSSICPSRQEYSHKRIVKYFHPCRADPGSPSSYRWDRRRSPEQNTLPINYIPSTHTYLGGLLLGRNGIRREVGSFFAGQKFQIEIYARRRHTVEMQPEGAEPLPAGFPLDVFRRLGALVAGAPTGLAREVRPVVVMMMMVVMVVKVVVMMILSSSGYGCSATSIVAQRGRRHDASWIGATVAVGPRRHWDRLCRRRDGSYPGESKKIIIKRCIISAGGKMHEKHTAESCK